MTGSELAPIAKDSAVKRAKKLYEGIASRRHWTELNRIVAPESIAEMQETGLFQLLQPAKYGGQERPADEFFDAVAAISEACPSTGWLLGILGASQFEIALMEPAFQEELFQSDPRTLVSSSYSSQGSATTAAGGFRLSGRWRLSSGVDHAGWVLLGANDPEVEDDDKDVGRSYVVPIADCQVIDDWYAMGLAGTGSKSIVVDDAYVPVHRTLPRRRSGAAWPGQSVNTGPLFRLSPRAIFAGAAAAPALGAAREMYRQFVRELTSDAAGRRTKKRADTAWVQARLANAQSLINNSERRLLYAYRDMTALAESEGEIESENERRFVWDIAQTADDCLTAGRSLFEAMGVGALYNSNPMQALYRDLITIRQHGTQARDAQALAFAKKELAVRGKKKQKKPSRE